MNVIIERSYELNLQEEMDYITDEFAASRRDMERSRLLLADAQQLLQAPELLSLQPQSPALNVLQRKKKEGKKKGGGGAERAKKKREPNRQKTHQQLFFATSSCPLTWRAATQRMWSS